jgi:signal transduction histidine kinase
VSHPMRLDTTRNIAIVLAGAVLAAPLLSSFIDAALVRAIGWGSTAYWDLVAARFFANVLAQLTIVPLVLTWAAAFATGMPRMSAARLAEVGLLIGGLFVACLIVFVALPGSAHISPAVFYAPLPFLLWAAVRFGPLGIASSLPVLTVATIWGAVHGLGPFTAGTPSANVLEMQLFLIAASVPLILFAVALDERIHLEHESRAQLTHLSRVATLGELSGGIAHELNQPLTAILSNAQAARHFLGDKPGDRAMLAEILEDIITADQRAGHVIERLRAMFKRGETQFERVDLNALVREVGTLTRGDLTTRGVEVTLRLASHLPEVQGDRVQLEQVLLNLMMNAAESMALCPQKDRVITVHTLATASKVHLNVVDRGPGFSVPATKLFEAFYTTKPKGLGLGLSISRTIITAHGGRLWASTRRGGGASFLITLPALRRAEGAVPGNVKIIRSREFIRLRADGEADLEAGERLLKEIAQAGEGLETFEVLVDTREVSGRLSTADLWTLCERLVRYRRTFAHRTAILCPLERFDHARFFALCAENHGFNIQAFSEYEDAMEWLLGAAAGS